MHKARVFSMLLALAVAACAAIAGSERPGPALLQTVTVIHQSASYHSAVVASYSQCHTVFGVRGGYASLSAECEAVSVTYRPTLPAYPTGALMVDAGVNLTPYGSCWLESMDIASYTEVYTVVCPTAVE